MLFQAIRDASFSVEFELSFDVAKKLIC